MSILTTHVYIDPARGITESVEVAEVLDYHHTPYDGHYAHVVLADGSQVYRHLRELHLTGVSA